MSKNADKDYSYLDYCVLPELRAWVLSVEPVILFDRDLGRVLWSNAAGAAFFDCENISNMLQTRPSPSQPFIKQLQSAIPQIEGRDILNRGFRMIRGMRSQLIDCAVRHLELPNGNETILLTAFTETEHPKPDENETARAVVNSLRGFASASAIVDDDGLTLAANDRFSHADIDLATLTDLITKVISENDRLVKSPIETMDGASFALGIARISDHPGRNLIVMVVADEGRPDQPNPAVAKDALSKATDIRSEPGKRAFDDKANNFENRPSPTLKQDAATSVQTNRVNLMQRRWQSSAYTSPFSTIISDAQTRSNRDPSSNDNASDQTGENSSGLKDPPSDRITSPEADTNNPSQSVSANEADRHKEGKKTPTDNIKKTSHDEAGEPEPVNEVAEAAPQTKLDQHPENEAESPFSYEQQDEAVRFAWTINTDQVFISVSPEFAETVGPRAADVLGRKWSDVATVFGFDTSGSISQLLSKKDTWSGKSVLWPVQGTDIVVPIDLAALPAFDADRSFEGFKGFGIIRTADAILDPNSVGLALSESKSIQKLAENHQTVSQDQHRDELEHEPPIRHAPPEEDEDAAFIGNVVDLVSRLPATEGEPSQDNDNLSTQENEYFTEIGERLRETAESEWEVGTKDHSNTASSDADEVITPSGIVAKSIVTNNKSRDPKPADNIDPGNQAIDNSILDEIPVPVLIYQNGDTLFANAQLLELTQFGSTEEIGETGGIDSLLDSTESKDGTNQHRLRRKNGDSVPVNPIIRSVPWNKERAVMVTFQVRDISKPGGGIPLPDADTISEMQDILDTATDGIIVLNREGIVESFNGSAEALFGTSSAQIVGTHIESLFALESRPNLARYLKSMNERRLNTIINDGCEVIGREANGGLIPLFITLGKIGDTNKLCLVIRDMTSWKKSEEDLVNAKRQAEKASDQKSDFLARVSHEIRTPLNAIIGFSDVMIEERFGPIGNDRYKEYLLDINRSGIHVLDLINDLLDLSKIESGKIDLSFEAVDLNQIVSETVALMQPQANSNRIIIRTSLSRVVPKVVADARSMRQIIMNLVSNAIKFSQANGQVIVSTVYEGNGEVALRIRDTGVGMTEEELKDAMKPFYQIPGVSEKSGKGTGLGLPLTKALVEANRAHFDLESQLNQGTIAHVQFPTQRVLAD